MINKFTIDQSRRPITPPEVGSLAHTVKTSMVTKARQAASLPSTPTVGEPCETVDNIDELLKRTPEGPMTNDEINEVGNLFRCIYDHLKNKTGTDSKREKQLCLLCVYLFRKYGVFNPGSIIGGIDFEKEGPLVAIGRKQYVDAHDTYKSEFGSLFSKNEFNLLKSNDTSKTKVGIGLNREIKDTTKSSENKLKIINSIKTLFDECQKDNNSKRLIQLHKWIKDKIVGKIVGKNPDKNAYENAESNADKIIENWFKIMDIVFDTKVDVLITKYLDEAQSNNSAALPRGGMRCTRKQRKQCKQHKQRKTQHKKRKQRKATRRK